MKKLSQIGTVVKISIDAFKVRDLNTRNRYLDMMTKVHIRREVPDLIKGWRDKKFVTVKDLNKLERDVNERARKYSGLPILILRSDILEFLKKEYSAYNVKLGGIKGKRRGLNIRMPECANETSIIFEQIKHDFEYLTTSQVHEITNLIIGFRKQVAAIKTH